MKVVFTRHLVAAWILYLSGQSRPRECCIVSRKMCQDGSYNGSDLGIQILNVLFLTYWVWIARGSTWYCRTCLVLYARFSGIAHHVMRRST
jgi:hypothetical protein